MRFSYQAERKAGPLLFFIAISLASILRSEDAPLINIKDVAPGIRIDMRYATANNFTGKKLYPVAECLLCEPVARRLARVQASLEKKGLGLKVWDCYRPLSIQKQLWSIVPDPRYVADPKTGSRHNRGASVDLTLVDASGAELPMPTGFDEFTDRAHRDYNALPLHIRQNRALLQTSMEQEGFIGLPTEWWHFDAPEWTAFSLRDEPLGSESLRKDLPESNLPLPPESSQLITVLAPRWDSSLGTLQRYERENGAWKKTGESWSVSLGTNGMAWSSHNSVSLPGVPQKSEGDNAAPAGLFRVGKSYGYADLPPEGVKWPYQSVDEKWICVDDPKSAQYNKIFSKLAADPTDWASAESMKRKDHLYKWLINIEQNPTGAHGCGSCIFFHIWRKPNAPTEGCTAMEEHRLVELLTWLDPSKNPVLIQMPEDLYRDFQRRQNWP